MRTLQSVCWESVYIEHGKIAIKTRTVMNATNNSTQLTSGSTSAYETFSNNILLQIRLDTNNLIYFSVGALFGIVATLLVMCMVHLWQARKKKKMRQREEESNEDELT